ncbi:myotrophin isoform X1 [Parasteatoda tepidariorum]|uniref:myotrophin isoform X1 n=1 Tax=Parasteatoda tepidariorum TaxID=114398 RepID=UPI00077FAE73|nr:myotrophin isoform X1 [Parasteatoda tepidariorum]
MSDFLWSLTNGDLEQVKDFVENQGVDINNSIDGRLPIHYAADYGQRDVLNYLIDKGANIDAKDKYGISALLAAIWEGHTSCVKLMLEKGATKSGFAPDGKSYIDAAEKEEIKQLLKC